jgi:3-methyladenine DNA glycosylase AlkD
MFNLTERLVEGVASAYSSQIEAISKIRADQLAEIKSKIRTNPDEVEAWFDKEIARISKIDLSDLLRNMKG